MPDFYYKLINLSEKEDNKSSEKLLVKLREDRIQEYKKYITYVVQDFIYGVLNSKKSITDMIVKIDSDDVLLDIQKFSLKREFLVNLIETYNDNLIELIRMYSELRCITF